MVRAFTLIELMIALTVVAILAGLLIVAVQFVRLRSRLALSENRINEVLNALGRLGGNGSTPGQALTAAANLPGVRSFTFGAKGALTPAIGAWLPYDQPWQLRFPWGQPAIVFTLPPGGTANATTPGVLTQFQPRPFAMSQLDPARGDDLLTACGIAPSAAAWRSNRSTRSAWNDAWGNPLVAAYAIYQYGPASQPLIPPLPSDGACTPDEGTDNTIKLARQWQMANDTYRSMRLLYVAIGAIGPVTQGPWQDPTAATARATSNDPSVRQQLWTETWTEINAVCNRNSDGSESWRVDPQASPAINAMTAPPWKGLRLGRDGARAMLLSPPEQLP